MQRTSRILTSALALALGCGTASLAQVGGYVETLASASGEILPLRGIDPETRARNRMAIVIGNSDYTAVPDLPNALADADAMAQFFRAQGYVVSEHTDITKRDFENILRRVMFDADADTEVVVFYAGHGFQIGNENYLVPVDADLDTVYDVPFESVSLGALIGIIGARARLTIVMLDSCRDNPFAGRSALTLVGNDMRETRTGFTSQPAPLNSMLVFSTAPGSVAFDGEGDNSPFTAAFVQAASATPDALAQEIIETVRRDVYQQTEGRQVPWDSSTLIEPASFGLGAALARPIAVNSFGIGMDRGIARVGTPEETAEPTEVAARLAVIDASFSGEVAIGPALSEVAGAGPLTILSGPAHGNLLLTGADGVPLDTVGRTLTGDELADLMLVNRSVQTPAVSLGDPAIITDRFTVQAGDQMIEVQLNLAPNPCDFEAGDHLDPDGMGITRYANEIRPELALAACEAAIAAEPEVGRFHYQLGRAHLSLRQFDQAQAAFEAARDLGHVRAWNALGTMLYNAERLTGGLDRAPASEAVLELYARGSVEGDPYAMYSLGWQLLNHGATDSIQIEGYDLVMRSLEVGHTFAMNAMAQLYLDDEGEFYDPARGLRYLNESAARGDIYGINALGLVYWRGRGDEAVDLPRAFALFTQASAAGHPTAPYNLARMYRDGDAPGGVDMQQAVAYFIAALDRGHATSAAQAAYLIRSEDVAGYDDFDAAAFAARGATLLNANGVEDAEEQLASMDTAELIGGAQRLLEQMGADLRATGTMDAATVAAITALAPDAAGLTDDAARIRAVAAAYWAATPFRVDLY
jgi:TPR repeat protein